MDHALISMNVKYQNKVVEITIIQNVIIHQAPLIAGVLMVIHWEVCVSAVYIKFENNFLR